jgi:6-phosphogluconolactonase (cycloisomerase 2 family)
MKNLKFIALLAFVLVSLGGSLRAEFLYVSYGPGLMSFAINDQTGSITALPGSPLLIEGSVGPLALARSGRLLYASTGGDPLAFATWNSIFGYRIKPNGRLQALPGSPFKVAGGSLAVDPFNRFLYAAAGPFGQNGTIAVYSIEANGGLKPVPGSPFPAGNNPTSVTTDPFGRFVYVANLASRDISAYRVLANGTLTPVSGSPFPILGAAGQPITVVADPLGRFLYAANLDAANLSSYRIGPDGALTPLAGSPSPTGGPWYENMAIDPSGRFLYVLVGVADLDVFRLNNVTGLPEPIQFIGVGNFFDNNPVGVAVDPPGKFVYEANANGIPEPGSISIRGFHIDSGGTLTLVPGSPVFPLGMEVGTEQGFPYWMVIAPDKGAEKDN